MRRVLTSAPCPLTFTPILLGLLVFAGIAVAPGRAIAPRSAGAQGTKIGFAEDWALATDRAATLKQLIPGTPDYYYYHCRHLQDTGAFDRVDPLLRAWVERHGRSARVDEIENRQALLTFDTDPNATYGFLRQRLSLRYAHRRETEAARAKLPTRLDPTSVSAAAFAARALRKHRRTVKGFKDTALEALLATDLSGDLLMDLLRRLERPDVPNLPARIVENLGHRRSRGFGSLGIHGRLLLDQLEECVRLSPKLLNHPRFVTTYLQRLRPPAGVDVRRDAEAREAYLDRLQAFANRLSPAHNSLKAHVLYHRLRHDLAEGKPDRDRFIRYLRLPRSSGFMKLEYARPLLRAGHGVDLNRTYETTLARIGDDAGLVRDYFMHFFRTEDSFEPYREMVREDYLRRVFAETKILAGQGDMERWYSMLDDPAYYERLKDRVEIEFAPTQRRYYAAGEPVALDVDVKNVRKLLIKVFEINTMNYYRANNAEVDASIGLDGLVANAESTAEYTENALRRVRRRIDLPSLAQPGVYVVELIGNGMSSRAVIHKGRVRHTERQGAAGHVFTARDENGAPLPHAVGWFGGKRYPADERGEIVIPYSTKPGVRTLILEHGRVATLVRFSHAAETYALTAQVHLERESLVGRTTARILVRPVLRLNGRVISLDALEEPMLTIRSKDRDGTDSSVDVRDVPLDGMKEFVHEIRVPTRLASISVSLSGRVKNLSRGKAVDLRTASRTFHVNGIDATKETASPLLGRTPAGYVLDVLGKNGEPKAGRAVTVTVKHRDYTDDFSTALKTDESGRIHLGLLPGITSISASGLPKRPKWWWLDRARRTWPSVLHGRAGESIRVPIADDVTELTRVVASLLEVRGGNFTRDRFANLRLEDGVLELRDLPAGDYDLLLKRAQHRIRVSIVAGEQKAGWIVGADRMIEASRSAPVRIRDISIGGDALTVRLANTGKDARVHVVATRYLTGFDPFVGLRVEALTPPTARAIEHAESTYHSGREIGEEYRYILDRRFAKKYPGNMLERPGVLLNPWAIDEEAKNDPIGLGGGSGGAFGGRRGGRARRRYGGAGTKSASWWNSPSTYANLGFLPNPPTLLANLRPDARGEIRVPLERLGEGQLVHVVVVDDDHTAYRSAVRAEVPLRPQSRQLTNALASSEHHAERRKIEFVPTGGRVTLADAGNARATTYDSLASVYRLFTALSGDQHLAKFSFILRWPQLKPEEKRGYYDKFACHELHFFLHEKDPEFFRAVVRPHLANKAYRTFLDDWLLEADLSRYLEPWAFNRLNIVEKLLLARRAGDGAAAIQRHVIERCELTPPNPAMRERLFASALESGALDKDGGLVNKLDEVQDSLKRMTPARKPGQAGRPPSPPAVAKNVRAADEKAKAESAVEEPEEEDMAPADEPVAMARRLDRNRDLERRKQVRELYRSPDRTRAWVESNYWRRRNREHVASLIDANEFWRDFALAPAGRPFFSSNLAEATGNFAEMMFALALIDLPFESGEHRTELDGTELTLTAASPLLLVRKEIVSAGAGAALAASPILVSQNYYRLDEPYRYEGQQRFDAFVTGEFLVDVAYGCRVVVTNPSSTPRELELLLQIPSGAIPVNSGFYTRGRRVALGAFATTSIDYSFYFPAAGSAPHYPVHVARDGELIAFAPPVTLEVVPELSQVDRSSWQFISQNGTTEQVLEYLGRANVQRTALDRIAWRMRDKATFEAVIGRLRDRHAYADTLWSYGVLHRDARATREYLRHQDRFLARCGAALVSPLAVIDPVERNAWELVEYSPLFNGRAHRLGREPRIANAHLARQYEAFLRVLGARRSLDDADWVNVTYYLLLQDRVEDALASFARVRPERLQTRVQYDYMRAYLDFFSSDHAIARTIAEQYRDYPVARWRARFRDVANHLDEVAGKTVARAGDERRTERQTKLAREEPSLGLSIDARRVTVAYRNVRSVDVRYYLMDVEFLFSSQPFVQQGSGAFSFVRPNGTETRALPAGTDAITFDLPDRFKNANVLVEVSAGGITRRVPYYANALDVTWSERYGQLQVARRESNRPLHTVYVKVFARMGDRTVRFYKDGYTDLRGRFDYASLSATNAQSVETFSILVLSEEHGAIIREVKPPAQ